VGTTAGESQGDVGIAFEGVEGFVDVADDVVRSSSLTA
jgi:hypothetical protein